MLLFLGLLCGLISQELPWNTGKDKVVANGYDVVSYFEGSPGPGSEQFSARYYGGVFHFQSEAHLKTFRDAPEKYLPQYGGWCAYAMAESGAKIAIDPETYTITEGKLFLFYNAHGNNTLIPWQKEEPRMIKNADQHWKSIID